MPIDNYDMYSTAQLLMGEPSSFGGVILLYIFAFLLTIFGCIGGFIIMLSIARKILRL